MHDFLEEQARAQEPWDGPAALIFTDGRMVGAKLDRNGLRPLRYTLTTDGLLIVGSEVGIADLDGKKIAERQRLGPGEMLLADPSSGTLYRGSDISGLLTSTCAQGGNTSRASASAATRVEPAEEAPSVVTSEPRRIAAALGWTRRSIPPALSAAWPRRQGSHLEHG